MVTNKRSDKMTTKEKLAVEKQILKLNKEMGKLLDKLFLEDELFAEKVLERVKG
jgi:hypothetical protein